MQQSRTVSEWEKGKSRKSVYNFPRIQVLIKFLCYISTRYLIVRNVPAFGNVAELVGVSNPGKTEYHLSQLFAKYGSIQEHKLLDDVDRLAEEDDVGT